MSVLADLLSLVEEMKAILEDELLLNRKKAEPQIAPEPYIEITEDQADEIRHLCRDYPDMLQDMLVRLNLESLERMPRAKYRMHIERLRSIVNARKEIDRPKILD